MKLYKYESAASDTNSCASQLLGTVSTFVSLVFLLIFFKN